MKTIVLHQDKLNWGILGTNNNLRDDLYILGKQIIDEIEIKDTVKVYINSQGYLEFHLLEPLTNEIKQRLKKIILNHGFITVNESDNLWCFCYVGIIHAAIMKKHHWNLWQYHQEIKKYSIYQPYYLNYHDNLVTVFYVPVETSLNLSESHHYQITGNNQDGFIVVAR